MKGRRNRSLAAVMVLLLLLAGASGCTFNSGTIDGPVEPTVYQIATFEGNRPYATFSFCAAGSDSEVRLTADAEVDTTAVKPGARVLMAYAGSADAPCVTLKGVAPINTLRLAGCKGAPSGREADSVWVVSAWRAGQYIDLRLRLPYTETPREFAITVDTLTLGTAVPQLYLLHRLAAGTAVQATFNRNYYASVDIGAIWNLPTTRALELHIANSNLPAHDTFLFEKQQNYTNK